jgi:methionine-rich copper-binding protein CopC
VSAAIVLVGAAPPARGHAIVIASSPRQDAVVAPGATTLELDYNSRIDRMRSRATLQGPDGAIVPLSWLDGGRPTALRAQVALRSEGTYVVRWQVLSDDGHITRGTVSFRVGSTAARR